MTATTELPVPRRRGPLGIDLSGAVIGEWTVSSQHRPYKFPGGQTARQWECTCSCGVVSWVFASLLMDGGSLCCGAPSHSPLVKVGQVFRSFTVKEIFPLRGYLSDGSFLVTCKCGRTLLMGYQMLTRTERGSCGCEEGDTPWILGDPNLPPEVSTLDQFIGWAGCSRQAYYLNIKKFGREVALDRLTKHAESNHPGEGWRVRKVIPVPRKKENL